ncbi:uncharacterized protein JCM10292_006821 [Rhodotorula paludigena]|uniref:uncharacterized protein n=1 Tax=Rhodotorula paludigena TaxID=86838 RepID=UPI0031714C1C
MRFASLFAAVVAVASFASAAPVTTENQIVERATTPSANAGLDPAIQKQLDDMINQALARLTQSSDRFNSVLDDIIKSQKDRGNKLSGARLIAKRATPNTGLDAAIQKQLDDMINQALARLTQSSDRFNSVLDDIIKSQKDRGNKLSGARLIAKRDLAQEMLQQIQGQRAAAQQARDAARDQAKADLLAQAKQLQSSASKITDAAKMALGQSSSHLGSIKPGSTNNALNEVTEKMKSNGDAAVKDKVTADMGQKKDAVDLKTDVINKAQSDNAKAVQQSMDGMMKQIIDFLKSMQDAKAE